MCDLMDNGCRGKESVYVSKEASVTSFPSLLLLSTLGRVNYRTSIHSTVGMSKRRAAEFYHVLWIRGQSGLKNSEGLRRWVMLNTGIIVDTFSISSIWFNSIKWLSICWPLPPLMATHSSTLAWKIPWMEEPGSLQSMGSWRVRHDWATSLSLFTLMHWRRKWQPTSVFLPGESQGWGSLVGCCLWGRTELDTTEAT